jgi:hypothetical protein
MSTGACFELAASKRRRSPKKTISHNLFGGAAAASLLFGCTWIVYANIFAASVYPQLGSANFDAPLIRRPGAIALRSAPPVFSQVVAALSEPPPVISAPATVPAGPLLSFQERFAAAAPQGQSPRQVEEPQPQIETPKLVEAPKPVETLFAEAPKPKLDTLKRAEAPKPKPLASAAAPLQVAAIASASAPRSEESRATKTPGDAVRDMAQRAKAAVMSIASADRSSIVEKLWGKPQSQSRGSLLAYASADASVTGSLGPSQNPALEGAQPRYDRSTAVYDISAHTVYLPDGTKLEAHSGLGSKLDDPRSAHIRMHGVTPPHLYDLTPREALFHGVPALRLTPVGGEDAIYGRTGLLAHTFMLGPNGDSNGCVSFRDYNAFLNAYRNQGIKRLAVVAKID